MRSRMSAFGGKSDIDLDLPGPSTRHGFLTEVVREMRGCEVAAFALSRCARQKRPGGLIAPGLFCNQETGAALGNLPGDGLLDRLIRIASGVSLVPGRVPLRDAATTILASQLYSANLPNCASFCGWF